MSAVCIMCTVQSISCHMPKRTLGGWGEEKGIGLYVAKEPLVKWQIIMETSLLQTQNIY